MVPGLHPFSLEQALLKKHEALMSDLSAYGSSILGLKEQAQSCRVRARRGGTRVSGGAVSDRLS